MKKTKRWAKNKKKKKKLKKNVKRKSDEQC